MTDTRGGQTSWTRPAKTSGWGRAVEGWTLAVVPEVPEAVVEAVGRDEAQLLARGAGRSYGDASMNTNRVTLRMDRLDRALAFDPASGVLTCEAGMSLRDILVAVLPRGWFLPVTPGTSHPTVGGSIACDVHGKNHHQAGTISRHVQWIELVLPDGRAVRCGPGEDEELFHATCGGMGLTGVIRRVALKLMPVQTAWIHEEAIRVPNLREMMARLTAADETHPYTVAWLDASTAGGELGRGQVLLGRHAGVEELPPNRRARPLSAPEGLELDVPLVPPLSLVNNLSVRAFNALRWESGPKGAESRVVPLRPFFYPLDAASRWNRLYGPAGFVQYQFVIPFAGAREGLRAVLRACQRARQIPSLIVLKRFGAEGPGMLSFPKPGWTLAMDLPVVLELWALLEKLDRIVLEAGGRVYLVKDMRLPPETFRRMYPRFGEWLEVKRRVDPDWRFQSDLSRRLELEKGV